MKRNAILLTGLISVIVGTFTFFLGRELGWRECAAYFTDASECKVRRKDFRI